VLEKLKEYYVIIGLVVVFLMGWVGHGMYTDKVAEAIAETRQLAAESAAKEIAKIEITNTTVQGKIIERIRTEQIYSECRHSPDTYKLIQDSFK